MASNHCRISACLIVKNEARLLRGCLDSIKEVVDEILVGDTGSTDQTPVIACDMGARLYPVPWIDDFSDARNRILEKATGDWILSMDADERLRPIPRSELELSLSDPANIAYHVLLHPKSGWTGTWVLRLFRKDPEIRFKGVFHEAPWEGLNRVCSRDAKQIGFSTLVLDHLGYDDPGDQRAKLTRNLSLLLKEIERDPDSAYVWGHLGLVYGNLGEDDLAEEAWQRAIGIIKKKKSSQIYAYIYYIEWLLSKTRPVWDLLTEAMECAPDNPLLYWFKGRVLMDEARYDEALPLFERLILWGKRRDFNRSYMAYPASIFDLYAHESLATCHFRLGDYEKSQKHFEIAEKMAPNPMEYRVKRQLCRAMIGPQ